MSCRALLAASRYAGQVNEDSPALIYDSLSLTLLPQFMCQGKVAYAAQMPFLTKGTVRDNILFGEPFDHNRCVPTFLHHPPRHKRDLSGVVMPHRYERVLDACALRADLATFPSGDMTVISGTSLSGGQRQRVSLARAAYSSAEVCLHGPLLQAFTSGR